MNTASQAARLGTLIDSKYRLVRLLGTGGMSAVYEARHIQLQRRVAIKFLLPEIAAAPELIMRFRNEARAAGALQHENVAAVYDSGVAEDGSQYLVMEYLEGSDCAAALAAAGVFSRARAIDSIMQVCRGLAEAHEHGIVHRDLKPANLFLTKRADGADLIKVLDFGIAKLRRTPEADLSTGTGATLGTPHYMSPEQARGDRDIDQRSDVYSLGVIFYEFLSGRKPHEGDSVLQVLHRILTEPPPRLSQLRADLPASLCAVVERAMAKERDSRFGSMQAFLVALQALAAAPGAHPQAAGVATANALNETLPSRPSHAGVSPDASSAPSGTADTQAAASAGRVRIGLAVLLLLCIGALGWALSQPSSQPPAPVPATAQPVRNLDPAQQPPATASGQTPERPDAVDVVLPVKPEPRPQRDATRANSSPRAAHEPRASARESAEIKRAQQPEALPAVSPEPQPASREVPAAAQPKAATRLSIDHENPYQ